jgi:hypothetical protein
MDRAMAKIKNHQICIYCTKLRNFYRNIPEKFPFLFTVQFLMRVFSDEKAFKDFNPVMVDILD